MSTRILTRQRVALGLILLLALPVLIDITFFYQRRLDYPLENLERSDDRGVIARGDYLVYGPARCADCHGAADRRADISRGKKVPLSGGLTESTLVGTIVFPNITPDSETGIGRLSDGELARSIRTGINHRGEYGLPFMNYQTISRADLIAIVSFLRIQAPVYNEVGSSSYNFLGRLALAYFVRPEISGDIYPDDITRAPKPEYGRYLAEAIASCRACHTDRSLKTGAYLGPAYAGGMPFEHPDNPGLSVVSSSLRPEAGTDKVANYTKIAFVERMKAGQKGDWSPMPWGPYSRMTSEDMEAIYLYLSSLEPL